MKSKENPTPTKHYCCLYHFTQGKSLKASSPCYNHVQLGVINPLPSSHRRIARPPPSQLQLQSRSYDINNHNHDLNQIQNKMSLPKRLAYPRVYVEQLTGKANCKGINTLATHEAFFKKKQFQDIFNLFRRLAKLTHFRIEQQLYKSITAFARQFTIQERSMQDEPPHFYFSHSEFANYLVNIGFQEDQAEDMWGVAFNQARFFNKEEEMPLKKRSDMISMKAFCYNFRKFYLDEMESFKNCLSEAALRQRQIDLRLFLQPWFNRNIIFKENHAHWKELQLQLCAELKNYEEEDLYVKMIGAIQLRNKIWLLMRILAKVMYAVTDQKNIGLEIFNQRATQLINKYTHNLQVFSEFLDVFETHLLQSGKSKDEEFQVTDLLQFAKVKFSQSMPSIMCYLRGIFKYLYFFKKSPLLSLNKETLNLDCSQIAQVSYNTLVEFLGYKSQETDHLMQMVDSICTQINEVVEARPDISGHKVFLNQCNFLSQAILKMVKRCQFSIFYKLHLARKLYLQGKSADTSQLKSILEGSSLHSQEVQESFWKRMFMFQHQESTETVVSQKDQTLEKNYQMALGAYQDLRKKLEGKLPSDTEQKNQPLQRKTGQQVKSMKKQEKKGGRVDKVGVRAGEREKPKEQSQHQCFNSAYCPLCDQICSTEVASSLSKVDSMSSYLMDLLKDI